MKTLSAIDHVRSRRDLYLPDGEVSSPYLASCLVSQVLEIGAGAIQILNQSDWYFVGADVDWFSLEENESWENYCKKILPITGARRNEFRKEILLMAFAQSVISQSKNEEAILKGNGVEPNSEALRVWKSLSDFPRAVGWRL